MALTDAERAAIDEAAQQLAASLPPFTEEEKAVLRILLEPVRIKVRGPTKAARSS